MSKSKKEAPLLVSVFRKNGTGHQVFGHKGLGIEPHTTSPSIEFLKQPRAVYVLENLPAKHKSSIVALVNELAEIDEHTLNAQDLKRAFDQPGKYLC